MKPVGPALIVAATAAPAVAQDGGWTYSGTLYGWLPGLFSTIETPRGDVGGSDVTLDMYGPVIGVTAGF